LDPYMEFGEYLKTAGIVAIAYSGGFDSTFMLAAASEYIPRSHIAVFVDMPMLSERQRGSARRIAERLGSPLVIVGLDWDDMPGVKCNNPERCYFCKSSIYSNVRSVASEMGCDACICGDNYDDLRSVRPGRRAAEEMGISKPLEDLGITRADIVDKVLSMDLGCDIIKDTCLSTRIPFGIPIDEAKMRAIESYEQAVRRMCGVKQLRFRLSGDSANIQTAPSEIYKLRMSEEALRSYFLERGITIRIDPDGYGG
jgi:pyridinium-3,5-biscarboxylic acid mononucleotide sulfurtransferase